MEYKDKYTLVDFLNHISQVDSVEEDRDQIRIVTKEDPDNSENTFGWRVLEGLVPGSWASNDCEGCYNEYVVFKPYKTK